jgi:epsilon-lactone hydrolase
VRWSRSNASMLRTTTSVLFAFATLVMAACTSETDEEGSTATTSSPPVSATSVASITTTASSTAPPSTTQAPDDRCVVADVSFASPVPATPSREMVAAIDLARAEPQFDPASLDGSTIEAVIADQRQRFDLVGSSTPLPPDVTITPADGAPVPARWFTPATVDPRRVVVYTHGGGYVVGSVESHGHVAARLAVEAQARVLFVEYRLAPEAAFPAPIDDVTATYRWLLTQNVDPTCVTFAADSIGAGGALSVALALRDAGDPLPAALALMSPVTDQTNSGPSRQTNAATDPIVTDALTSVLTALSLQGFDPASPVASPLFAPDLSALPPVAIWVSTSEALLDDSRRFAEAATAAGTRVEVREYPGAIHVWPQAAPSAPESAQTIEEMASWLIAATG